MSKDCQKEWKDERILLKNLVAASKIIKWPTPKEFILSELVNGVIDYAGGNAGEFNYQHVVMDRTVYESKMYDYLNRELKNPKKELLADIKALIDGLVKPHQFHCPPDRPFYECNLYDAWGTICPSIMRSTFSLPYDFVVDAKEKLELLDSFTREEITGISNSMKRFVEEDLEHIRKNYQW